MFRGLMVFYGVLKGGLGLRVSKRADPAAHLQYLGLCKISCIYCRGEKRHLA